MGRLTGADKPQCAENEPLLHFAVECGALPYDAAYVTIGLTVCFVTAKQL